MRSLDRTGSCGLAEPSTMPLVRHSTSRPDCWGWGNPGGPAVEVAAKSGDPERIRLPRPLSGKQGCNLSFSGLKTSVGRACEQLRRDGDLTADDVADISAGFQRAVSDILAEKTGIALEMFTERFGRTREFAVCGGVAANSEIRSALNAVCSDRSIRFIAPDPALCTDNGAMIAWAGIELIRVGVEGSPNIRARPRWPLDDTSDPILGHGKRGPKS